jgi:broad specificity phosphatase PhoE
MTVTTVFLVRHAVHSTVGRVLVGRNQNVGLSSEGLRQAGCLAECFSHARITAVRCSPQLRARETAGPIAHAMRMPFLIAPELDEIDTGDWTGHSFDELANDPRWRRWNSERATARVPNGESMDQVQERVARHLAHVATTYVNGRVVIVTHAEIIRAAILHLRRWPLQDFAGIDVDPASVTTVRLRKDGGDVVRENQPVDVLVAA